MSQRLINLSPDLKQLQDEGYEVEVRSNHLLLRNVPYVTKEMEIKRGMLVSELTLAGDITTKPNDHVVMFSGKMPCDQNGNQLERILLSSGCQDLGGGLVVHHQFSSKPPDGYSDYYSKMTTYANIISRYAQLIDPTVSVRTFAVVETHPEESVFKYLDTASSRAGIGAITEKLATGTVAIIGLGGTGSYILDLIAKTPIPEIHLFDGDRFGQHNAFRSPGAPSVDVLRLAPRKSDYYASIYSQMRRKIFSHGYLKQDNIDMLKELSFAFVAVDDGHARRLAVETLEEFNVPFIDVGMGLYECDESLGGQMRVNISTPSLRDEVRSSIPFREGVDEDDYSRNIQIADLNALNAILAVIKWKKFTGFYVDLEQEHSIYYQLDGNHIINQKVPH